jgi:hypothetical protein
VDLPRARLNADQKREKNRKCFRHDNWAQHKKREIKLMSFSLLLLDGAPFCFNYRLNSLIGGLPLVLLTLFAK